MTLLHRLLAVVTLTGWILTANAQPLRPEVDYRSDHLADQRELFTTAWYAARRDQITHSQRLAKQLRDYPLYPDLEAEWLAFRPREARLAEAIAFVSKYPNTTAARTVSRAYMSKALQLNRWHWYEQFGDTERMPVEARCRYALTLLNTKARVSEGEQHGLTLWQYGKSRPSQCDPLFKQLSKRGVIDDQQILNRLELAMLAGQKRLSQYLIGRLNTSLQGGAKLVWRYRFDRNNNLSDQTLTSMVGQALLRGIFKHMARDDSRAAAARYLELVEAELISDRDDIRRDIARYVFLSERADSHLLLTKLNPLHLDEDISNWVLRAAVREQDWLTIADLTNAMVATHGIESLTDRQRYWRAHASLELGDPASAQQQWRALAQERSFYGFMSADLTGAEYSLNHQAIDVDEIELQELAKSQGMRRLREWLLMGEVHKANLEWALLKSELSQRELLTAARLAEHWQEPNLAIQASIAARYWNDIELRFPLNFRDEIDDATTQVGIDNSLVMSLTRQESAFNEKASSPVGALGLMQLMPSTARQIAKTLGLKVSKSKLLDGETNITLGTHYLESLLERYSGNTILATAAYNAGPYRVDRWLEEAQNCQRIDTWIESIPYNETRHYVQNILTYRVIYDTLMGRPARLMRPSETMLGAAPVWAASDSETSEKTNL